MALPDPDSSVGHSFGLELDGVTIKQINEVSGLTFEQEMIELKENTPDGDVVVRRLPGRPKAGEVTLTRGLTHDDSFETWIRDSRFGKRPDARKGGAIIVFDYEGATIRRFQLTSPRLKDLERGTGKADGSDTPTERLILTHKGSKAE
jgi:phage tail-like protein